MQIYFTGNSTAPDDIKDNYVRIIKSLENNGHKVITEELTSGSVANPMNKSTNSEKFFNEVRAKIRVCDMVIVEITYPVDIVGSEINYSLKTGKPVVLLSREDFPSKTLVISDETELLFKAYYNNETLETVLNEIIKETTLKIVNRFTFNLPSSLKTYLEWKSNKLELSRSEFIKSLIEREMQKDDYYLGLKKEDPQQYLN
jgi:hypothetical protein